MPKILQHAIRIILGLGDAETVNDEDIARLLLAAIIDRFPGSERLIPINTPKAIRFNLSGAVLQAAKTRAGIRLRVARVGSMLSPLISWQGISPTGRVRALAFWRLLDLREDNAALADRGERLIEI